MALQTLGIDLHIELAHISLPALYRHRPLYHVALYHELGHFVDTHYKISESTMLQHPPQNKPGISPITLHQIELRHRMEYFADLFAASYTGVGIHNFLNNFAPGQAASHTHPATNNRLSIIDVFLNGKTNPIIDLFHNSLQIRSLPQLIIRFESPELDISFGEIRPVNLNSTLQVHGILDAGWSFLERALDQNIELWNDLDNLQAERILNDLIEKSVRNLMVKEKWNDETA